MCIVQANPRGKIRPAVPGPLVNLVEMIVITHDITLVAAMLGGIEPSVRAEGNPIRITQPTPYHFQLTAVRRAAQDRSSTFSLSFDDLLRRG